jgi:DNA-binding transcriptional regulator YiaG
MGRASTTPEEIKKYRLVHDLSLEEMAARCEVSLNTVWKWEAGKAKPSRLAERQLRELMGK